AYARKERGHTVRRSRTATRRPTPPSRTRQGRNMVDDSRIRGQAARPDHGNPSRTKQIIAAGQDKARHAYRASKAAYQKAAAPWITPSPAPRRYIVTLM